MSRRLGLRRAAGLATFIAALAVALFVVPAAFANTPLPHAAFTTTDTLIDSTGHCQNGNEAVNCNIYDGKQYVWLNGGPTAASLDDGQYFFAVVVPGGQGGNENPNDCTTLDLSDFSPCVTSNTGAGDTWADRIFTVSSGSVSYSGTTHTFDAVNDKIRLMPYDNTTNNGGVYILAICSLADIDPAIDPSDPTTWPGTPPGVDPSDCKYDAFKVSGGTSLPPASGPTVTKDASGAYNTTYTWGIGKSADKTIVKTVGATASFTYTVHVTHDAGSVGSIGVAGTITISNPNVDAVVVNVSDVLSDSTACTVKDGSTVISSSTDVTVPGGPGSKSLTYSCAISGSTVPTTLTNKVTVSWGSQLLDDGSFLVAGSTDFTTDTIAFSNTNVDNCTTVTDPIVGGGTSSDNPFPKTVCVGDIGDGGAGTGSSAGFTFTYHVTYAVTAGCHDLTNTATESTDGNSSSVTVTVCGPTPTGALTIGFWKTTNGQNLVKTYCQNPALANYLKGLGVGSGPFSNAPTTSCTDLANYVLSILNGATATNMNNMLKAQMLGTALDVWFSGPGWTSTTLNKIKPPSNFLQHNNLGTFKMDTTAVCPMVDNTTAGTATCKNNTPSTDAVASGAVPSSPMAMQAILDFASTTPSPFNGSTLSSVWYGGDRTKQEILKNIFDQFNNQLAFGSF